MLEDAVVTSLSSHPSLGDLGRLTFNELSGDTLSSESATGDVINSPIIVSKPHYPPSDSDDDDTMILAAQNSFSHVSLVSDNSVDDEFNDSGSLDTLLSSASCSTVTGTLQSSKLLPRIYGLGISGLTRKDGSGPFDGLGIVSIKSSAWRHDDDLPQSEILLQFGDGIDQSDSIQGFNRRRPSNSIYDGSLDSEDFDHPSLLVVGTGSDTGMISDVFLQQTLLTFTQDPFHQLCDFSIPDCDNNNSSWSELGLGLGDESASSSSSTTTTTTTASMSELSADDNDNNNNNTHSAKDDSRPLHYRRRRVPKLNTNFSSATISSELKRSSTVVVVPKSNWRQRSSSWPCSRSTMDGTTVATTTTPLLPRCKWRL